MMTVRGALLQTLLFGPVELCLKKFGSTLLSGTSPGFLAPPHYGQGNGKAGRTSSFLLTTLQGGLTL